MTRKIFAFGVVTSVLMSICPVSFVEQSFAQSSSISTRPDAQGGLVAQWHFDENSGTRVTDTTGKNPGTLVNGTTFGSGKIKSSLVFDGLNDGVSLVTNESANNLQTFTVSAWIYHAKDGGIIFRKGSESTAYFNFYTTQKDNDSGLPAGVLGLNAGYDGQKGTWYANNKISLNAWHHVAVTYTKNISANPIFYIDGVLQPVIKFRTPTGNSSKDDPRAFLGNNHLLSQYSGVVEGKIDEVRLYNRALSSQEVKTIYEQENIVAVQKPNIVVIMTDDLDDQGMIDVMPNLKNLITDNGVRFTNSFVNFPVCCVSRTTFFTGQTSGNHGLIGNAYPDGGYRKFLETGAQNNTLQIWMKNAGYKTALLGKYINGYGYEKDGISIPSGWDRWFGVTKLGYYNWKVSDNGTLVSYGSSPSDYLNDVLSNKAVDFIKSSSEEKPLFITLTPYAPHHDATSDASGKNPYPIPAPRHDGKFSSASLPKKPSFNEADVSDKPSALSDNNLNPLMDEAVISKVEYTYQKRLESLLAIDDMVANIVGALKTTGKYDNTIIIFTSDNGFFNGEHRIPTGKEFIFEEAIKVPLIISGPGISKGEKRVQLTQNIDLAPTILELGGAVPGRLMDGKSLVSLLKNNSVPWRTTLLLESSGWVNVKGDWVKTALLDGIRTERFSYAEHTRTYKTIFPTDEDQKGEIDELLGLQMKNQSIEKSTVVNSTSIVRKDNVEYELYDLNIDPYQLQNKYLDPGYISVVTTLKARLNNLKNCAGEGCWNTEPEPVVNTIYTGFPPVQMPDGALAQPMAGSSRQIFTVSLKFGMTGIAVKNLQIFLNRDSATKIAITGPGSPGKETTYFGSLTRVAVAKFQEKYASEVLIPSGLSAGTGYVGTATLKKLNELVK